MFSIDLEKLLLDPNQPTTEKSSGTMTEAAQNPSYTSHEQSSQDIQCEPSSHKPSSGLPFSNKNIVNEGLKYEGEMSITMERKLPLNKTAGVSIPHLHRDNERENDPEDNPGEDQCEAIVITGNGLDQTADITVSWSIFLTIIIHFLTLVYLRLNMKEMIRKKFRCILSLSLKVDIPVKIGKDYDF